MVRAILIRVDVVACESCSVVGESVHLDVGEVITFETEEHYEKSYAALKRFGPKEFILAKICRTENAREIIAEAILRFDDEGTHELVVLCRKWLVSRSVFRDIVDLSLTTLCCSLQELADEFGVALSTVSRWSDGSVTPDYCAQRAIVDYIYSRKEN